MLLASCSSSASPEDSHASRKLYALSPCITLIPYESTRKFSHPNPLISLSNLNPKSEHVSSGVALLLLVIPYLAQFFLHSIH